MVAENKEGGISRAGRGSAVHTVKKIRVLLLYLYICLP